MEGRVKSNSRLFSKINAKNFPRNSRTWFVPGAIKYLFLLKLSILYIKSVTLLSYQLWSLVLGLFENMYPSHVVSISVTRWHYWFYLETTSSAIYDVEAQRGSLLRCSYTLRSCYIYLKAPSLEAWHHGPCIADKTFLDVLVDTGVLLNFAQFCIYPCSTR